MKSLNTSLDETKRPSRSDLNQAFRMLDQNKDRKLSIEEFKNVQMMMNSRMPVPLIVLVIAHCSQCQCCICGYFDCWTLIETQKVKDELISIFYGFCVFEDYTHNFPNIIITTKYLLKWFWFLCMLPDKTHKIYMKTRIFHEILNSKTFCNWKCSSIVQETSEHTIRVQQTTSK